MNPEETQPGPESPTWARRPETLVELVGEQARRRGDQRAYVFLADGSREEASLTFGQLDEQARAIAGRLRAEGLAGTQALLLFPGGLEFLPAFLGCAYAGVVAVPAPPPDALRWKRTWPRLEAILRDCGASSILTTTSILASSYQHQIRATPLDALRWFDVRDLIARDEPGEKRDQPFPGPAPHDLAYLQYTSGSTTSPKGVEVSHHNVLANCAFLDAVTPYPPGSVSVTWMPYFHDFGLVHGLLLSLYEGICCYVLSPMTFVKRPERWLQAITTYRATHTQSPNFGYQHCVNRIPPESRHGLDLSSLLVASNGAEPINPETIEAFCREFAGSGFRREAMAPGYGLAENTLAVSTCRSPNPPTLVPFATAALERGEAVVAEASAETSARTLVGCGRVDADMEIAIVDPERLVASAPGRIGEIWVRHPSMGRGYWGKPEATRAVFGAVRADTGEGPYLRTGDLGFFHDEELFIAGRLKDLMIVDGVNHYPQDVEWTVEACRTEIRPGSVAAFSIEAEGREQPVVLAEIARSQSQDFDPILAAIRAEVGQAHGLNLHAVLLLKSGEIIKTSSGKISRGGCRAAFLEGTLETLASWTATAARDDRSATEPEEVEVPVPPTSRNGEDGLVAWFRERIAALLKRPGAVEIGLDDPLERLGLTSRELVTLTADLEDRLGRKLGSSLLYEHATIRELFDHLGATRLAADPARPQAEGFAIAIAANFTAQPVEESLRFWAETLGWPVRVAFAAYNQVFQELLDPAGLFATNRGGVNVVMVRIEDWLRSDDGVPVDPARLTEVVEEFLTILREVAPRSPSPIVLMLCPHAPGIFDDARLGPLVRRLDAAIVASARAIEGVILRPVAGLDRRYAVESVLDPRNDRMGHIPYTSTYFSAIGTAIIRTVHALKGQPAKVIALDCDNTLWRGVCGEDGPDGIEVTRPFAALQRFLVARQEEGMLLCLLSKNAEADVLEVFRRHPGMPLALDRIVAHRINWEPKSANLIGLARELDLGLESFVVIDDNPLECREIQAGCPEATILPLPSDPERIEAWLEHLWVFDRLKVTDEDRGRTEMVRQEQHRGLLRERATTLDDFLDQLGLEITIEPIRPEHRTRAAQLTRRTNQFNTTTLRYDEAGLRSLEESGAAIRTIQVRDRFGDYGLVGLAIFRIVGDRLVVESLMLSCRVLGRRVEHAFLEHLATEAGRAGAATIAVAFRPSSRNEPVLRFLQGLGGDRPGQPSRDDAWFAYPIEALPQRLARRTERGDEAPDPRRPVGSSRAVRLGSEFQRRIAEELTTAEALRRASRLRRQPRPELDSRYVAARTPVQVALADIWGELVGVDRVGIEDDFFALGGDSLRAAELLARVRERLGVDLPMAFLEAPTVARLAEAVEALRAGRPAPTASPSRTLEAEARLDPEFAIAIPAAGTGRTEVASPPGEVFFTGATGYLGAYLIAGLLESTDARIHCLVRGGSVRKVLDNLRFYDLWVDDAQDRLVPIDGDLAQPMMGLSCSEFRRLAETSDAVYHCGAWVNFVFPYSILKPANVDGTRAILRLTTEGRPKPLHFISTLGVLMAGGYAPGQVLLEDGPIDRSEDLPNGYEQTKWVADRLVQQARDRGVAATIYRPGMLTGDSRTGIYHKIDEFASSWMKGCIQLGSAPDVDTALELVPIDYAARAIVAISLRRDAAGKTYHLNHPRPIHNEALWDWVESFGYPLRRTAWETWKGELTRQARKRDNALFPYFSFLSALKESQAIMPSFDSRNTQAALAEGTLRCPEMTECLERYFRWFIRSGWLPAPSARRSQVLVGGGIL